MTRPPVAGTIRSQPLSAVSPMLRIRNGSRSIIRRVIDLPDILAAAVGLLTVALFAAMIWAGNHQH
jgi:hypothetical protein